jgi:hypothetical protein
LAPPSGLSWRLLQDARIHAEMDGIQFAAFIFDDVMIRRNLGHGAENPAAAAGKSAHASALPLAGARPGVLP